MNTDIKEAHQKLTEQQKINQQLSEENKQNRHEIDYLKERIDLLLAQLYGKKSEQLKAEFELSGQLSYLEDLEEASPASEKELPVHIPAHIRKKSGRKPLPEDLPRIEVIHDIPEDQKQCQCGSPLNWIGEEVSEQLDFIPAQLRVIRHIRPKYACRNCEGVETEGKTVKIAPPPKQILPKSIASPGLLA
jgi:transposase